MHLTMWQFLSQMLQLNAHKPLPSFKIGKASNFPIILHGLSLNTINNALIRALECIQKEKHSMLKTEILSLQPTQILFNLHLQYFVHPLCARTHAHTYTLSLSLLYTFILFSHGTWYYISNSGTRSVNVPNYFIAELTYTCYFLNLVTTYTQLLFRTSSL
jgi:hypothetical protein